LLLCGFGAHGLLFPALQEQRSLKVFTYAPFSALALSWISLYALFTMKRWGWLTRDLPVVPGATQTFQVLNQASAQPVNLNRRRTPLRKFIPRLGSGFLG
jgi:hypothetical protein